MRDDILIWDLETVPDIEAYGRVNRLTDQTPAEIRNAMGDEFPKLVYHSIVCIGALLASPRDQGYEVRFLGTSHVGDQSERELIRAFLEVVDRVAPRMVTFNGSSFDLPVLRYRAMIYELPAPGLTRKPYFHRYQSDHADLCDVLSSFSFGGKAKLDELSRAMGLSGKPDGMDGSRVEALFNEGRADDIAEYCLSDVILTYRLWLRYELFCGRLTLDQYNASEAKVAADDQGLTKPLGVN